MQTNEVKLALQNGQVRLGVNFGQLRSQEIPVLLARAGFHWAFIDTEHGGFDLETVQDICRVARLAGLVPLVRVADLQYALVARALDCGAQGIIFPRMEDPKLLETALSWTKFPPYGVRGYGLLPSQVEYATDTFANIIEHLNSNILTVLQIESKRAVEAREEILSVPGIDAVMIGPADLSISLGVPGQFQHPSMITAMEAIRDTCNAKNIAPGTQTRTVELARFWKERGMRFLGCGSELSFLWRRPPQQLERYSREHSLRQVVFVALLLCTAWAEPVWQPRPEELAALDRISAASMRGHVSFLASDALEGRSTPSRGLDIAAEYIASQFRRAGLEPAGAKGSYFQTADFVQLSQKQNEATVVVRSGADEVKLKSSEFRITSDRAIDAAATPVLTSADSIAYQVVFGGSVPMGREPLMKLRERKPQMIVLFSPGRLIRAPDLFDADDVIGRPPVLVIFNNKVRGWVRDNKPVELTVHSAAPSVIHVSARNVAGILRGSDAALKDQFVVLSAHYDHVGMKPDGAGDRIFNGANDNASGTASVIEIAAALSAMQIHPKRSILFLTFFGEEKGLLGAYYYTRHPLVPLANTTANLNLEQMGRVDGESGKKLLSFALIGAAFSDAGSEVQAAAQSVGVSIFHENGEDSYFNRSDHFAFAESGVVSLTAAVTFEFPDYHAVGDEWEKLDYSNMARVDRGIAAAIINLANRAEPPQWKQTPETAPYRRKEN